MSFTFQSKNGRAVYVSAQQLRRAMRRLFRVIGICVRGLNSGPSPPILMGFSVDQVVEHLTARRQGVLPGCFFDLKSFRCLEHEEAGRVIPAHLAALDNWMGDC
ncbi:hypothetical protein PviCFBP13515_17330 [Pseudomonas viridiflava]|nr:hypothetical protein PviCFBP13507_11525 [Pseudomonas viridiflava]TKK25269.1 hypothetical protein PviCFBP13515_17330 [Pseudomonas viridiflava]